MRFAVLMTLFAGMSVPAAACNEGLFTVTDWRAEVTEDNRSTRTVVNVDLRYDGKRGYRMIHAAAMFSDAIGNALASPGLERDANVRPGDGITITAAFRGAARIATIDRDDVHSRVCVWSIVYDDGTIEEFR